MNFNLTEEQVMLRDTVAGHLGRHWEAAAHVSGTPIDIERDRQFWASLCELGIQSTALPAEAGGFDGGPVETMITMEEFGRKLVHSPYLGTAVIMGGVLKRWDDPVAHQLMEQITTGALSVAFAQNEGATRFRLARAGVRAEPQPDGYKLSGTKSVVQGGPVATHLLVTAKVGGDAGISLFLVPIEGVGVTIDHYQAIDGQPSATVLFDGATAALIGQRGQGLTLIEPAIDDATLALCAEAVGIMEELISQTTAYLAQRKQFGQPLISFQALQHRLADMTIQFEQAKSMLLMGTLTEEGLDRPAAIAGTKIQVDRSLRFVSQQAVQLHGGMGITDELAIGRYFKRSLVIMATFGSEDDHFRRYENRSAA